MHARSEVESHCRRWQGEVAHSPRVWGSDQESRRLWLQAADQYLLEPLKELCAKYMTSQLSTENVLEHYELAMQFNAAKLEHAALAFLVEHAAAFQAQPACPADSNDSTADEGGPGTEERGGLSYAYLLARLHPALQVRPRPAFWTLIYASTTHTTAPRSVHATAQR